MALREAGHAAVGTYAGHPGSELLRLDLRDRSAVGDCIERAAPTVVFLTASLTNVDYCETHPDESYAVNVQGARNVAATGVRVVYFSSDYVFAGESGPCRESDTVRPLNVYGQHKVLAEQSLSNDTLIIRTTVVYGPEA